MSHIGLIASDEQVHAINSAAGSREMWQAVLHRAFVDATYDGPQRYEQQAQREAHSWIASCGKDFRQVCALAGMDADFLSNAYNSGRVDRALLKGADRDYQTTKPIPRGSIQQTVIAAISGEMSAKDIASKVQAKTGHIINPNHVSDTLRSAHKRSRGLSKRKIRGGVILWSREQEVAQ